MSDTYYLNVLGSTGGYAIVEATGRLVNPAPVAMPSAPFANFAWPSAIKANGVTRLYFVAMRAKWDQVFAFTKGAAGFVPTAPVLTATEAEGGIGPSVVVYIPGEAEPFHLYYSHLLSNKVSLATSSDGLNFTRRGIVLSLPQFTYVMLSSVVQEEGEVHLLFHGVNGGEGDAFKVSGFCPAGPFTDAAKIAARVPFLTTLSGTFGDNHGIVPAGVQVPIGLPVQVMDGDEPFALAARAQVGSRVYFTTPLLRSFTGAPLASIFNRRMDISHVEKRDDGTWWGLATGFAAIPDKLGEYTGEVEAPSLDGPFVPMMNGIAFDPYYRWGTRSTENPAKLQVVS